jgi:phosphoribosylglycinamide formyltransferase-1
VIGVLVSGEGSNLQALIDAQLPVAAVASNRIEAPALGRAERAGIPTAVFELGDYASRDERDVAMADWLSERSIDLVVCAGYMHLLTERFLERFPQRIVNVHPALLPRFPGVHPIHDALAAGACETGATVHFVDDGVDTGPVIRQERVAIEPGDTVESVRARVQAVEHRILPAVVRELIAP